MLPRGPIARATVRTSAVLALKLIAQAAILLLLAYLLGPSGFGAFAAVASLAVLLGALATFGTHLTLLRDLARDTGARDRILHVVLGTTAVCGGALFFTYLLVAFVLFRDVHVDTLLVLCLGLSEILVQPFLLLSATQRHAVGRIARSQLLMALPLILRMTVLAGLWICNVGDPLVIYAVGHLLAVVVALALSLSTLERRWPHPASWRILDGPGRRDSAGFALMMITANGPAEVDKILAARLLPLDTAGLYAAASRVIGASVTPILSMMVSALPRLFLQTDRQRANLLKWLFVAALAYGIAAFTVLHALAPLIDWAFGTRFFGVGDNIRMLALAVLPMCLRVAATNTLMTMGSPWLRVGTETAGIVLLLLLALGLTPSWSTTGLIIAVAITELVMALLAWTLVFRLRDAHTEVSPMQLEPE